MAEQQNERGLHDFLLEVLNTAKQTLFYVQHHAPGYDWNADELGLTLKTGEAFAQIDKALQLYAGHVQTDTAEQQTRRHWAEADLRYALKVLTPWKDLPDDNKVHPYGAELMLSDALDELIELRQKQRAHESTKAVLKRLVHYYDGRASAALRIAEQSRHDPVLWQQRMLGAYVWQVRAEVVRKVAENLEISLPAEQTEKQNTGGMITGYNGWIMVGEKRVPATIDIDYKPITEGGKDEPI